MVWVASGTTLELGARITGIDLRRDLDDGAVATIRDVTEGFNELRDLRRQLAEAHRHRLARRRQILELSRRA